MEEPLRKVGVKKLPNVEDVGGKHKQKVVTNRSFSQVVGGMEESGDDNKGISQVGRRWRQVGENIVNNYNKLGGVSKNQNLLIDILQLKRRIW